MNLQSVKLTVSLLKKFANAYPSSQLEFLETIVNEQFVTKDAMKWFVTLTSNILFFDVILDNFYKTYALPPKNKHLITVQMYILIFELDEHKFEPIKTLFKILENNASFYLLHYFTSEYNLINIAQVGTSFFGNDYVTENIIKPLLENQKYFIEMCHFMYDLNKTQFPVREKDTQPIVNQQSKKQHRPKVNLPQSPKEFEHFHVTSRAVPITTYYPDRRLQKNLRKVKLKNRENASKLFAEAQSKAFRCAADVLRKEIRPEDVELTSKITFTKPIPIFKQVSVKGTTSTLMREAARVCKSNIEELHKVQKIIAGGFDDDKYVLLEDEMRREEKDGLFKKVARNHLYGLLSHEDAKLSRKKYLEAKRHQNDDFKLQRHELRKKIEEAKCEEVGKSRIAVQKCKDIEQSAKNAEDKLIEDKQRNAKLINFESVKLKEQLEHQQANDLIRKKKLIEEIKTLDQLRVFAVKEFDETETVNLGLLCEMSIAELKERLVLMKVGMKEELEERQQKIASEKGRKEQLLLTVKDFVEEARRDKMVTKNEAKQKNVAANKKTNLCFQQGADELEILKERLLKARILNEEFV